MLSAPLRNCFRHWRSAMPSAWTFARGHSRCLAHVPALKVCQELTGLRCPAVPCSFSQIHTQLTSAQPRLTNSRKNSRTVRQHPLPPHPPVWWCLSPARTLECFMSLLACSYLVCHAGHTIVSLVIKSNQAPISAAIAGTSGLHLPLPPRMTRAMLLVQCMVGLDHSVGSLWCRPSEPLLLALHHLAGSVLTLATSSSMGIRHLRGHLV
jgi:hypothetical protein